jgi:hypothetical protein
MDKKLSDKVADFVEQCGGIDEAQAIFEEAIEEGVKEGIFCFDHVDEEGRTHYRLTDKGRAQSAPLAGLPGGCKLS